MYVYSYLYMSACTLCAYTRTEAHIGGFTKKRTQNDPADISFYVYVHTHTHVYTHAA